MMYVRNFNATVFLMIACSGCATFKAMPSRVKAFVMREPVGEDPLVGDAAISHEFQTAKKELKDVDSTVLAFAHMCESRGDFVEAKKRYQDLLADKPANIEARLGIARVEFATGRKAEAEAILLAAARMHPNSARVWMEMGRVRTARDQWGAAAVSLEKAVELEPANQQAQYELGLALARSNRLEDAVPHLKQAVGESAAFYNIGFVLKEAGRLGEAKFWIQRALESYPDQRTRGMSEQMMAQLNSSTSRPSSNQYERPGNETRVAESRVIPGKTSVEAYRETPKDWRHQAPTPDVSPNISAASGHAQVASATASSGTAMDYSRTAPPSPTVVSSPVQQPRQNPVRQASFGENAAPNAATTDFHARQDAPRIIQQPVATETYHPATTVHQATPGVARLPTWNGPAAPTQRRPVIGNQETVDPPMWGNP